MKGVLLFVESAPDLDAFESKVPNTPNDFRHGFVITWKAQERRSVGNLASKRAYMYTRTECQGICKSFVKMADPAWCPTQHLDDFCTFLTAKTLKVLPEIVNLVESGPG